MYMCMYVYIYIYTHVGIFGSAVQRFSNVYTYSAVLTGSAVQPVQRFRRFRKCNGSVCQPVLKFSGSAGSRFCGSGGSGGSRFSGSAVQAVCDIRRFRRFGSAGSCQKGASPFIGAAHTRACVGHVLGMFSGRPFSDTNRPNRTA